MFLVGVSTGLRGNDLLGLRWGDVAHEDGTIRDRFSVTESKTNKVRTVPLPANAKDSLVALFRVTAPENAQGYVFTSREGFGGRLSTNRLRQLVQGWAQEVGIEGNFGVRTLRKTFGYQLRQAGVGIEVIMRIFGHSSQSITMRYLGIHQEEIEEASLKLNL